jgi:hypothetical protein
VKWLLALAAVVVALYLRRDRRTAAQRLRDAYLQGDRAYLREHLPTPSEAEFDAESWGWNFSEENADRAEVGLDPLDQEAEFAKTWFQARVEAYRKANPDLPWRKF